MSQNKWTLGQVQNHLEINCEDYGAAVMIGALYKKLYGEYPKIGLSGFQAGAIDQLLEVLPDAKIKEINVVAKKTGTLILERKADRNILYKKATDKWGFASQLVAACEELGELIVEVAKMYNGKRPDNIKLIDELADVKIMIEQIENNYCIDVEVDIRKLEKLKRLQSIINKEGNSHPVKS